MSEPETTNPEKKTSLFLPSLEELKTNLKDDDRDISPEIRGLATEALGSFPDPRALPLLRQLAREDTGIYSAGKRVREAARSALEKF